MPAFMDYRCTSCNAKNGFCGDSMSDAPPCRCCGAAFDPEEAKAIDLKLAKAREEMFELMRKDDLG